MIATCVNSIGLVFDIIGVVLLYIYIKPAPKVGAYVMDEPNEEEQAKQKKSEARSRFGLLLLIIGFSCQLASNYLS